MRKLLLMGFFLLQILSFAHAEIKDFVYDGKEIYVHVKKDHMTTIIFPEPIINDSSGKGGCENLESVNTYLTGRTAVAATTGDCRGSWGFSLNYIGICTNA